MKGRPQLGIVFFTVFLDLVGFGIVIPILPLYAEKMHATDRQIGLLLASYSIMQLVFAPLLGRLSDRIGRRPILLLSIAGSCVSQVGYALAPTFGWLVLARCLAGACGANISAAQAYVADVTDEKDRARGMGVLGAALGMGFVFGPAIGGALGHVSVAMPFFAAAGFSLLNFILAVALLHEPRSAAERTRARTLTLEGLTRTLSDRRLVWAIALFFVITFGFANLEVVFSLYLERRFGFGPRGAAWLFTYIGVFIVIVQGVLVRRFVARFGEKRLVVTGTAMMALGFVLLALVHSLGPLLVALAVTSIGNALNTPSLSALISRFAGADAQGGVLGVSQSAGALARMSGPIVATNLLVLGLAVPFYVGATILVVASLSAVLAIEQPA